MLGWLHRQQVSEAVVATVVAQAAAGLRVGPSRFDLAVRSLTAPGTLVVAGFVRVARWFTWVPGVLGLWQIRAVFGIVAVWQCLHAHQVTVAVTTVADSSAAVDVPAHVAAYHDVNGKCHAEARCAVAGEREARASSNPRSTRTARTTTSTVASTKYAAATSDP